MLNKHLWINELGLTVVPVRGVTLDYCCGPRVAMEVSLGISCRMAGPGVSRCSGTKFKTLDLNQLALGMRHEFLPIF